ncbi:ciliary microtubule-associated protein 3 [Lycaon pictus]|uniref:Primary cilia formation n=2 Tax=Canis lupus familiaris TaxID=9615 RepID=A0A8C0RLJ6_CANLF|nr:protein pitchfork-like isoform X1 [Canis lupus familiaris]XP_038394824.1 protein pitchfork-like isoform X1 [Canis lupus familiaris]XP_038523657.1 protein pitchfork-like isoform X1 [Canis lupus familiaris]|eukprot:XP_005621842.1 protein pitchfork-like isoform X1 [Canis lupus familiaris]
MELFLNERKKSIQRPSDGDIWYTTSWRSLNSIPSHPFENLRDNKAIPWITHPFLWNFANESLVNYPFGTSQPRKLFPHHHPPSLLGNKFLPLRGAPHRGPGCYIAEDVYGLAYNLSKIPTSKKGYTFGARTAERFKTINKDMMLYPGMYQVANPQEQIHKQNFAPFNALLPRFRTSKDSSYPGPGTYNPEMKPPPKITWPMKFGSPDWAQVPCLQKRTLKAELSTDKDFRKHRNRVAYLSLFYS